MARLIPYPIKIQIYKKKIGSRWTFRILRLGS